MLEIIEFICVITMFVLMIVIIIDMFKKKVSWGFLGLIFVLPAYYHAIRYYSGNRKVITPIFIVTSLFVGLNALYLDQIGKRELEPCFSIISRDLSINCSYSGEVEMASGRNIYFIWCTPKEVEKVSYQGIDDMVAKYQKEYIEPMIPYYSSNIHDPHFAIKLGIKSPHKMVACYEVAQGAIIRSWATGTDQACK